MYKNYTNKELRSLTKKDMVGNWGTAILLIILVSVLSGLLSQLFTAFNPAGAGTTIAPPMTDNPDVLIPYFVSTMQTNIKTSSIASIIVSVIIAIFNLGIDFGFLDVVDGRSLQLEHLIAGFNKNVGKNILTIVATQLIISIGMILLIPGIIFSYMLLPVPYLLKDDPDDNVMDILKKAKDMMKGHKFNFFKAALPIYLIPIALFAASIILLAGFLSQESYGVGILLFAIVMLAGVVASFWADIKIKALKAEYYRRILNPIVEYDDYEEDFINFEDITVDKGGVYVEDDNNTINTDDVSEDNYTSTDYNNTENMDYGSEYGYKVSENDIVEEIIQKQDDEFISSDDDYYVSTNDDFEDDVNNDSENEYTDTEFMEDMILLGEEDKLFGDNNEDL